MMTGESLLDLVMKRSVMAISSTVSMGSRLRSKTSMVYREREEEMQYSRHTGLKELSLECTCQQPEQLTSDKVARKGEGRLVYNLKRV